MTVRCQLKIGGPSTPQCAYVVSRHDGRSKRRQCACSSGRRHVIHTLVSTVIALPFTLQAAAAERTNVGNSSNGKDAVDGTAEASDSDLDPNTPVNKTVKEYMQVIYASRPKAWQKIAQRIQKDEYFQLSSDLVLGPFDDVRQACFFIPWALLNNNDFNAANDARKAYDDFLDHVKDLDRISQAASRSEARPEQVQQAFFLLSASLDKFIYVVPKRYLA